MVAPRTIRCKVITVDVQGGSPVASHSSTHDAAAGDSPRFRPSDLVPWADPYIAGLVHKLQAEVRSESRDTKPAATTRFGAPVADLEWPWDEGLGEMEPADRELVEADAPGAVESWNLATRLA